jgi:hypothetical protein
VFTITHGIAAALTRIERARGFLEAAVLSEDWLREMGERALVLDAHYTTHIDGDPTDSRSVGTSQRLKEGASNAVKS